MSESGEAIKQSEDYRPNNLITETMTVAVVAGKEADPKRSQTLEGVEDRLAFLGYAINPSPDSRFKNDIDLTPEERAAAVSMSKKFDAWRESQSK